MSTNGYINQVKPLLLRDKFKLQILNCRNRNERTDWESYMFTFCRKTHELSFFDIKIKKLIKRFNILDFDRIRLKNYPAIQGGKQTNVLMLTAFDYTYCLFTEKVNYTTRNN